MEYRGTLPMTGIDIEPDEGNFMANTINLDNVIITDITQYGIVNQHRRCGNLTITNSKIQNFDAPDAKIINTHLFYDNSKEIHVENCIIDKSYIELKNRTHLLKLHNVKLLDTLVESSGTTTRQY